MDLKKVFTSENPLFQRTRIQQWFARKGKLDVGRIAWIVDVLYNRALKVPAAFFSFFESANDPLISHQLFETILD